ncbi:MAG: hypothetical protein E7428_01570 [Ruminococcaceae bacterium]|nr:hypothetical protein [Oscillospiraceae bacterium]
MRSYLNTFFTDFDYPAESREVLLNAYDTITAAPATAAAWQELMARYEADYNCDFNAALEACDDIALKTGLHSYSVRLLLFICLSRHLRTLYRERGIADQIWYDSMCDLKYKLWECKAVKNIWGSFVAGWFGGFFNLTRFALGRLQFELVTADGRIPTNPCTLNGLVLRNETKLINVHIPRTLTPIDKASCDASYAMAKDFFKEAWIDGKVVFVCASWLLYPENLDILPEKSNIRRFITEFNLVKFGVDESGSYGDMWRLFDMDYTGSFDDYPEDTSVRRAFKTHLKAGGKVGGGTGLRVL